MARRLSKQAGRLFRTFAARGPSASVQTADASKSLLASTLLVQSFRRPATYEKLAAWTAFGGLLSLQYATSSPEALAESPQQPETAGPPAENAGPDVYQRRRERQGLPSEIILYQYEVCPFCNKVRAFLDYYKVPYRTVEVNPLTKSQLKWSVYKKVPVVLLDEEAMNDSSLILSRLAVEVEPQTSQKPPKSWFFSAKPAVPEAADAGAEDEERRWRVWVDRRFVQLLTVNIYRSMRESWQTFDYIAEHSNFSFAERQAARIAGSGLMYVVSGRMVRRYGIEGDLRQALYAGADEWVAAVGNDRTFMGGERPNLADLSMFGVIRSITGTPTFTDLTLNSKIGRWYEAMMGAVGGSSRLPG